jgi:hypothetical protein
MVSDESQGYDDIGKVIETHEQAGISGNRKRGKQKAATRGT